jgi:hypothetical protein
MIIKKFSTISNEKFPTSPNVPYIPLCSLYPRTCLNPAGVVGLSAKVKVDADTKPYGSLGWTSLKKTHWIQEPPLQTVPNVPNANPILEEDHQAIVAELKFLERRMSQLRICSENP